MSEDTKERSTFVPLTRGRISTREKSQNEWVATIESKVTVEDVCKPDFWQFVAHSMRPYDKIQVRTDDGLWYAELLVLWVDRTAAKVRLLHKIDLTTADVAISEYLYRTEYKGPHKKWCVINKTGQIVKDRLESQEEAFEEKLRLEKAVVT